MILMEMVPEDSFLMFQTEKLRVGIVMLSKLWYCQNILLHCKFLLTEPPVGSHNASLLSEFFNNMISKLFLIFFFKKKG